MNSRKFIKRINRIPGSVIEIALSNNSYTYGLLVQDHLIAFLDGCFFERQELKHINILSVLFITYVDRSAIRSGNWSIVGVIELPEVLTYPPKFFKFDRMSEQYFIYQEVASLAPSYQRPATKEECSGLERLVVWGQEGIEDRLRRHYECLSEFKTH